MDDIRFFYSTYVQINDYLVVFLVCMMIWLVCLHSKSTKRIPCCSNTWHSRWQAKWRLERRVWVGRRRPQSLSHLNTQKIAIPNWKSHLSCPAEDRYGLVLSLPETSPCGSGQLVLDIKCRAENSWLFTTTSQYVQRIAGYSLQDRNMCKE